MLLLGCEYKTKYSLRQTHRLLDVILSVTFQSRKVHFKTQTTFLYNLLRYRNSTDIAKIQKYHILEKFKKITMFKKELLHFEIQKEKLQLIEQSKGMGTLRIPMTTHYPTRVLNLATNDLDCLEYEDEDDTLDDVSEDYRDSLQEEIELSDDYLEYTNDMTVILSELNSSECTLT